MWESFTPMQKVFFIVALPATILLVVQSIMILIGLDSDSDALDATDDPDGDGIVSFIIRGMIAFFTLGGWSGFAFAATGMHNAIVIILALIIGCIAFAAIIFLIRGILKLQGSGNLEIKNSVGKTGKVYIPIPANRVGSGKITITLQERFVELDAVTNESERINTDEIVKVLEQLDETTVIVEKIKAASKES